MNRKNNFPWERLAWNGLMVLALMAVALGAPAPARAAVPTNDDFFHAIPITNSPISITMSDVDFNDANQGTGDPNVCGYGNPGVHTIWYSFIPTDFGQITVDTYGSAFDTIVAIWIGSYGSLQEIICNDDTNTGVQSEVKAQLKPGIRYYIEVIQYTSGAMPERTLDSMDAAVNNYMTLNVNFTKTLNVAGAGKYDDKSTYISYSGVWTSTNSSYAYSSSYKLSKVVGNTAAITFYGTQFKIIYTRTPQMGVLEMYLDGATTPMDSLNQYYKSNGYQQVYTSPVFAEGLHTLQLKHKTKYVTLDAIEIISPPDLVAPGTITDLSAVTGAPAGNVDLSWTAPGDDGTDGIAMGYEVRYATSPITNLTTWNAATNVTTGLPSPVIPGDPVNMTVSGLTPGMTYYFSVRAYDEPIPDSTPGGFSNSPSASSSYFGPFGTGTYEEADLTKWMYVGTWSSTSSAAASGGTYRYNTLVGDSAFFVFEGTQFYLFYETTSSGGTLEVWVDGVLKTSINQRSSTNKFKVKYTSDVFTAGQHTVQFRHGAGSRVYVDAIQIIGLPDNDPPAAITDLAATAGGTYGTANLTWTAPAEDSSGTAPATSYQVRYSLTDIVDESTWASATTFANTLVPKAAGQTENLTITGLGPGSTYYFAVRAVDEAPNVGALGPSDSVALPTPPPVGAGTYDNTNTNWLYSGFLKVSALQATSGSFHRSSVIGSTATFVFSGTSFTLTYTKGPTYGLLDVYVDGVLVTPPPGFSQYAGSLTYKQTKSFGPYSAGTHTIVFRHASGTYTSIDGITIVP